MANESIDLEQTTLTDQHIEAPVEHRDPSTAARETIGAWIRRQNEVSPHNLGLVIDRDTGAIMTSSEAQELVVNSESGDRPKGRY